MVDCPDLNTQKIEYDGLATISDSKIVRAEINSIDEENNCANVTLLDVCEATAEFDFTAIKFDYLCEDKTERTAIDLLDGYKAFSAGDIVYILFLPIPDTSGNQAYIIGHIDIKETKKCGTYEYVLLILSDSYVTIFDVANNSTLDLTTFVSAPECLFTTPSTLPCAKDTNFDGWFACNFITVTDIDETIAVVETYYTSSASGTDSTYEHKIIGTCPDTFDYYTHDTFTFTNDDDGEFYILNNTYDVDQLNFDYTGFEIPKNPTGACYYYDGTHTFLAQSFSGSYSGWKFTDIAGSGPDIYININISHYQYKQRRVNYNPGIPFSEDPARYGWIVLAGNETYSVDLIYPYNIQGIGTDTVNSLLLSYLDEASEDYTYVGEVSPEYIPLNHYTPHWLYIELDGPGTINPMDSDSRFFGDYGFYYIRPLKYTATDNSESWYKWMSIVSLQSSIGEITEINPVTIGRYLQNIDNNKSIALANTAEELFTFASVLHPTVDGAFYTCPCQKN